MATDSPEKIIEISGLERTLAGQKVLRGIDLEVYRGETLVILGRSGEGKSVLLNSSA